MNAVNALLHKRLSDPYLHRNNSDFLDYQCQHTDTILYQRQTNGRDLVSYRCQTDTNSNSINAKPMGTISLAINNKRTLAHTLTTPNQWPRSKLLC